MNAKPLIKWVGGKRKLIGEISSRLPEKFDTYVEPFVGGGAVLFHVLQMENAPSQVFISDANSEIANLYDVVKTEPARLHASLKTHENDPVYYKQMRDLDRMEIFSILDGVARASRFIYLNKTAFNGIWRVNRKGQNNVPFGKYKSVKLPTLDELEAVSRVLDSVDTIISCQGFEDSFVQHEDMSQVLYYLDPPYVPLSATASFDKYTGDGFGTEDHVRLRDFCNRIDASGSKFILSNSNTELVRELYKDYLIEEVDAHRLIGGRNASRDKVKELIIRNYE